ncbi:MAG: glycosyltransferase [Candidatus Dormibacteria bacterium]
MIEPASTRSRGALSATMEVHFKLFGTDGVSLQSQELTRALRSRGWRVHSCASDVPPDAEGLRLPELSYQSPDAVALRQRIFPPPAASVDPTPAPGASTLAEEVSARAEPIARQVEHYLDTHQISLVHVRNLMSLPYNLPATLAFYRLAVERPDIGFVMQHHDFYWEGPNARTFQTQNREVIDLVDRIMCPALPNARHVLINPIAAEALRARKGIDGTVIPDGFDFDREVAIIDDSAFRGSLEILAGDTRPIRDDDLVVAMPARVAINKTIELAIQFVAALDRRRAELEDAAGGIGPTQRRFTSTSRIVLLLPQGEDLAESKDYFERLQAYSRHLGITLAYGGNIVVPDRTFRSGDWDHFPFYSTYQSVDLVCYPPMHEGFGNQAIETIWARRPLVILEYPVFKRFVRSHIPHYISLGDTEHLGRLEDFGGLHELQPAILEKALDAAIAVLNDHVMEARWTDENFRALRPFCGIDTVTAQYIQIYGEVPH